MKSALLRTAGLGLASVLMMMNAPAGAQTPERFVPFNEFMQSVRAVNPSAFATPNRVASPSALAEMREHVLKMYSGVTVKHSYSVDSGHFDCVPVAQQPSVRALGGSVASPPPAMDGPPAPGATTSKHEAAVQPTHSADKFGNSIDCAHGTIPLRRLTLNELARFPSLAQFFKKTPQAAAGATPPHPNGMIQPAADGVHHWAHAYQNVANFGGSSNVSVNRPYVNTSKGQIFSLSQHWYAKYVGGKAQTVEAGWQNFPGKYGTENSVLFIYYTADGYNKTGCYNHDCSAFVQVDNSIRLAGGFSHYSVDGGTQYEFKLSWRLYNGNWWLQYGSTWVGYYPGSLWGNANLAKGANSIDYGGEVDGKGSWAPMGSGRFANTGWPHSAYQRLVYYFINNAGNSYWATLTKAPSISASCATVNSYTNNATWHTYLYFGGPGGNAC